MPLETGLGDGKGKARKSKWMHVILMEEHEVSGYRYGRDEKIQR